MAPPRKGSLELRTRDGVPSWHARFTVGIKPHTRRLWYDLGTADPDVAEQRRATTAAQIAADPKWQLPPPRTDGALTVREYAATWLAKRRAQGVAMIESERGYLDGYALDVIGGLALREVRPAHIRQILDGAIARGKRRGTVQHIRATLHRMFFSALESEIDGMTHNPVAAVRTPKMRDVKKDRAILTDEEIDRLVACPDVDLELGLLSLVARCEGGARSVELVRWDWRMIDVERFASCTILRAKGGKPQALAIPPVLAPFLRAWWDRAGRPVAGPVFPVRRGKRRGQARRPASFAKALRRALKRALGVATFDPDKGERGRWVERDASTYTARERELFTETATTRPVDFHSFRRAFSTALAESGVNAQHAAHLTGHADGRTHARYVMHTQAMREIPASALPALALSSLSSATAVDNSIEALAASLGILERETGLEPATLSLGS